MKDYSLNPNGDLVWRMDSWGVHNGKTRVARMDLSLVVHLLMTTTSEAEFRTKFWDEVSICDEKDPACLKETRGKTRKAMTASA